MTDLSVFSKTEIELLVSLPYKAGAWIAAAEDEEGDHDDEREAKALHGCIKAIAGLHADKPLLKAIAAQTLMLRSEWPRWTDQCFNVPEDAAAAMSLLKSKAGAADLKNYRGMIMEISTAVAQAHGEFGDWDDDGAGFFARIAETFKSLSPDDKNHPMNVSAAEETALSELAAVLKNASE